MTSTQARNPVQETRHLGQSIWYDNIRRGLIVSGELQRMIHDGVTGLTSNPTIFEKAIAGSTDYDEAFLTLVKQGRDAGQIYESLAMEDIRATVDLLRPIYEQTDGRDGFASIEVSPLLAHDTEGTIAEAERLFRTLDRPNVLVKVPATPEGIPAVRHLIGQGVNVNITLIFALETYRQVREAYLAGLENLAARGGDVSKVASVASFFLSRVDTQVDSLLDAAIKEGRPELEALKGRAAIANARLAYQAFKTTFNTERFSQLQMRGARVQRPLWASTSTKNPAYSDLMYVEPLIGPDTVNTMPQNTLTAFMEHGKAAVTIEDGADEAQQTLEGLEKAGINMKQVTAKLLADGVKAFADSFQQLMTNIEEKRNHLLVPRPELAGAYLGQRQASVDATLDDLAQQEVVGRIWRKDHTVWKPDPTEISDRLGWLAVTDMMRAQVPDLTAFASEIREAGFKHVVLLGMGGSSLGPEVLKQTFGSAPGYPSLIVLDSTVPDRVQSVTREIDPARTLFLVSSKSGGTIETISFYRYFRHLVEREVGTAPAGRHFVAITDAGTSLEKLGQETGFRRVFLNPADIGGRYSALSYFGLVPAALIGLDLPTLLERAERSVQSCALGVPPRENPGASLGAIMGTLTRGGQDKLTLVTSPALGSFGLWVEQLLAESAGKEGKGIIPVAAEPLAGPAAYGNDRQFVYLRLAGDDNAATDATTGRLKEAGHPLVRIELEDKYDLGAEFFRWEFATSVAGAVLGIHPFDQPDVQSSKDNTSKVLAGFQQGGKLPPMAPEGSLSHLLSRASAGDYLAIMAYIEETPETDALLRQLRQRVMERHQIATTVGYGPRFLHSTGQLHKGGPNSGLFLQLTADYLKDLPIPGQPFSFGALATAQSIGDLATLQELGRRTARWHLGADPARGLQRLVDEMK